MFAPPLCFNICDAAYLIFIFPRYPDSLELSSELNRSLVLVRQATKDAGVEGERQEQVNEDYRGLNHQLGAA